MDEKDQTPKIGVVVSPDISIEGSSGAEEHVLFDIGTMIGDEFEIEIVSGNQLTTRLASRYENFNYLGIRSFDTTLLNAALLPIRIINVIIYAIRQNPNILFHIGGTGTNGLSAVVAGTLTGTPTIIRNTGDTFDVHQHQIGVKDTIVTWLKSTVLSQISMRSANKIITLGMELKQSLVDNGIDSKKIHIIPQPLSLDAFTPPKDKHAAKRRVGLPKNQPVALSVARLEREKGADRLYRIIESTLSQHEEFSFCVIGRGEFQSEFNSLRTSERVQYHEYVPHEEIADYYRAADVFLLPSRVEGVPNVILESLACGVPVLATPVGEVPHMLDETCESETEFVRRLVDEDLPDQQYPERYTWENLQKEYIGIFRECAKIP